MNFRVLYKGSDIKAKVLSYTREHNLCSSMSNLSLTTTLKAYNFLPYETITIEEDGVDKGEFYIATVEDSVPGNATVLSCQDATKRLADYFVPETTSSGEAPSYTRYWIEKYLDEAGVSYTFDTASSGTLVNNNSSFGMDYALSIITTLLMQSGWYMYADGNGTIHIGKVTVDMSNIVETYDSHDILDIKVNKNDGMLRNKVIVWGAGNVDAQDYVFAHMDIMTPWNRDSNDYRTVLISAPSVRDNATAAGIASQILHETQQITYIKEVALTGFRNVKIGDTVFVDSRHFMGAGIITSINVRVSGQSAVTILTLDERCPKIVGYYDYGDYVYVGTHGGGVWRKHLNYEHTWYNYSQGLSNLDVIDLAVYGGVFACVTSDGKLYTRLASESAWVQFSSSSFLDENGAAHNTTDSKCVACTVSRLDNHIMALFNLDGQVTEGWVMGQPYYQVVGNPRSWLVDFTNRSIYTANLIKVTDYNVYSFDIDHNGDNPYISAIYRHETEPDWKDWISPNSHFMQENSHNTASSIVTPLDSGSQCGPFGWGEFTFTSFKNWNYRFNMKTGDVRMNDMPYGYWHGYIHQDIRRTALYGQYTTETWDERYSVFFQYMTYTRVWDWENGAVIHWNSTDLSDIYTQTFPNPPFKSHDPNTFPMTSMSFTWVKGDGKPEFVLLKPWSFVAYLEVDGGEEYYYLLALEMNVWDPHTNINTRSWVWSTVQKGSGAIIWGNGNPRALVATKYGIVGNFGYENSAGDYVTMNWLYNGSFSFSSPYNNVSGRPVYSPANDTIYCGPDYFAVRNAYDKVSGYPDAIITDSNGNTVYENTDEYLKQISVNKHSAVAWVQQKVTGYNSIVGLYNSSGRRGDTYPYIIPSGTKFEMGRYGDDFTGDYYARVTFSGDAYPKIYRYDKNFSKPTEFYNNYGSVPRFPSVYENGIISYDEFNRVHWYYDGSQNEEEGSGSNVLIQNGSPIGSGATGWYPYSILRPTTTGGFESICYLPFKGSIDTSKNSPIVTWGDGAAHGWMNLLEENTKSYKDVYPSGWFMSGFLRNGPRCYDTTTYSGGTGKSYYYRRILYPVSNTVYNYSINNHTVFSGAFGTLDSEEGMYHSFPYEVTTVEATNHQDIPYLFVGTSGATPHFYQRDSSILGPNPLWAEHTTGLPANHISIIRVDDRI